MEEEKKHSPFKGRGSQVNTKNRFRQQEISKDSYDGIDDYSEDDEPTSFTLLNAKTIVNSITSPDIPSSFSANPYQGCEHGCAYCYARPTHEYWGLNAGIEFEKNILVKPNAAELLEKKLRSRGWKASPIMLSGNTDCYQPLEKKFELTRSMLKIFLDFKNPVGIISKNALILRDLDILKELAKHKLVHIMVSITTLDENLRRKMEPRTATAANRLKVIETLNSNGIPAGVMVAPIIPSINSNEINAIVKAAGEHGAVNIGYTIVRLNGSVKNVFENWLDINFPERKAKVMHQIEDCHGGKVENYRFSMRMKGEGNTSDMIKQLFNLAVKKHIKKRNGYEFNLNSFAVPRKPNTKQLDIFSDLNQ